MAEIGYGYGSECHLLRWMGRHRQVFGQAVKSVMETKSPITWLDFNFDPKKTWADAELKGLNFLTKDQKLQYEWKQWWPQTGNSMNWDAVGWLGSPENKTPILIEAKAHLGELKSKCGASESSLNQITRALKETGKFISAPFNDTWLDPHYQFTNRLAVLYFLRQRGYTPHLVNVYFVGDLYNNARKSPQTPGEWAESLADQHHDTGVLSQSELTPLTHILFLHVNEKSAWRYPSHDSNITLVE